MSWSIFDEEDIPPYVKHRPNWGKNQVAKPEEIVPGYFYHQVSLNQKKPTEILAMSRPEKRGDNYFFSYAIVISGKIWRRTHQGELSDNGVLPTSDGLWNPTNHLIKLEKKPLTVEEIEQYK